MLFALEMNPHYAVNSPVYVFFATNGDRQDVRTSMDMFRSCEHYTDVYRSADQEAAEQFVEDPELYALVYNAYGDGDMVGYYSYESLIEELQWLEVYTYYANMDRVPVSTEVIIDSDFYFSYNMPDPEQGDDAIIVFYHFALDSNGTPLASSPLPLKLSDMPGRVTLLSIPLAYKAVYGA